MAQIIGNQMLGGNGTAFAIIIAADRVIALIGTALSCSIHWSARYLCYGQRYRIPPRLWFPTWEVPYAHVGVIVLTVISAVVGSYGVLSVDKLTQVTLISNIGTFLLYGMTCIICIVAFAGVQKAKPLQQYIAPVLGAVLNIAMLVGVIYFAITGGGSQQVDTIIAGAFSIAWLVIGFAFLYGRKLMKGSTHFTLGRL